MIFEINLQFYLLRHNAVRTYFLRLWLSVVNQAAPIEADAIQELL